MKIRLLNLRLIDAILVIFLVSNTIPHKATAHTEQEYVDWCFVIRENRERANDRDRLITESRLWSNYDNEVEAIYNTYINDTWAAWETMAAATALAEVAYFGASTGCGPAIPCQNAALAAYLVAITVIQAEYMSTLNQIESTKNSALNAAGTTLQDGLEIEEMRHTNTAMEIDILWQECIVDAQHHTNPH